MISELYICMYTHIHLRMHICWQAFYDTCDELGILLYHDIMFANDFAGHHVRGPPEQWGDEVRDNVRRLSHHPSVVLYDACNECGDYYY